MIDIDRIATELDGAASAKAAIAQLDRFGKISHEDSYRIQAASVALREARGERRIGIKLGFTSRAKMLQMGVESLIWGPLTDAMVYEEGGEVPCSDFIHPRIEPELCFLTKKTIDRPLTLIEVINFIDGVAPAIELIDSRYANFKFSLADVIADNCSSAGVVVGSWARPSRDCSNLGVVLSVNGNHVEVGSTAAVLGNPLRAVVQASQLLADSGLVLPAGSLLMSGGATAAVALKPGMHVVAKVDTVGQVEFRSV